VRLKTGKVPVKLRFTPTQNKVSFTYPTTFLLSLSLSLLHFVLNLLSASETLIHRFIRGTA
jgi:hypothetical protein